MKVKEPKDPMSLYPTKYGSLAGIVKNQWLLLGSKGEINAGVGKLQNPPCCLSASQNCQP